MSIQKLLAGRKSLVVDPIGQLTEQVGQITASRSFNDEKIGQYLAAESVLTNGYNNIESSMKTIAPQFGLGDEGF